MTILDLQNGVVPGAPNPSDEVARLAELRSLALLDSGLSRVSIGSPAWRSGCSTCRSHW